MDKEKIKEIISWIISIVVILLSILLFKDSPIFYSIMIIAGIINIPPISKRAIKIVSSNKKIDNFIKLIVIIAVTIFFVLHYMNDESKIDNKVENKVIYTEDEIYNDVRLQNKTLEERAEEEKERIESMVKNKENL